jgi:hypothetical protein
MTCRHLYEISSHIFNDMLNRQILTLQEIIGKKILLEVYQNSLIIARECYKLFLYKVFLLFFFSPKIKDFLYSVCQYDGNRLGRLKFYNI